MIEISSLTKDYGNNHGVFKANFTVNKGEVYGFIGPNGAGKTTVIRHLMGFSKPDSGTTTINGLDCWQQSAQIKHLVGYLPGELAFPDNFTGRQYINLMQKLRGITDHSYTETLLEYFAVNPGSLLKLMSFGMKRKLALILAFMHDPQILILDEPTSGLDPIMQEKFLTWILKEKKKGKTIFLSSHIFEEVESACDKISFIKNGTIVTSITKSELNYSAKKTYSIALNSDDDFTHLCKLLNSSSEIEVLATEPPHNQIKVRITGTTINLLLQFLREVNIADLLELPMTLETYFLDLYDQKTVK